MTKKQHIAELSDALKILGKGYIIGNYCVADALVENGYGNLQEFVERLKNNIKNMYADNPYSGIDYNEGLNDVLKCIDKLLKEYI